MTWRYRIHGLDFESDFALPGSSVLLEPVGFADVVVRAGRPPFLAESSAAWDLVVEQAHCRLSQRTDSQLFDLRYFSGPEFWVCGRGSEIWVEDHSPLCDEERALYLLGPVFGLMLRVRGSLAFHASSVSMGGHAIMFAGPSGMGKSTTAAALANAGLQVVSDDVCLVEQVQGRLAVVPSYPQLRLWQDAALGILSRHDSPVLAPTWSKRAIVLDNVALSFQEQPLPLAGIYLLGPRLSDQSFAMRRLAGAESCLALIANTYRNEMLTPSMRAAEFSAITQLLAEVPVSVLQLPSTHGGLLDAIESLLCSISRDLDISRSDC